MTPEIGRDAVLEEGENKMFLINQAMVNVPDRNGGLIVVLGMGRSFSASFC